MNQRFYAPFAQWEAAFALYRASEDGRTVLGESFLGGCLENLHPEETFESLRLDRHGDALGRIFHKEESHRITIENLWVMEKSTLLMPRLRRNQTYVLVVVWYDSETGCWVRHSYWGVTAPGRDLSAMSGGGAYYQNITFTAFYLEPESGKLEAGQLPPALDPVWKRKIRYVSAIEEVDLYLYDTANASFAPIDADLLPGRAAIAVTGTAWELSIDGTVVLHMAADGIQGEVLTALGGTLVDDAEVPRVEFWSGPRRMMTITQAGQISVPAFTEEAPGAATDAFDFIVNGVRLARLDGDGLTATQFQEPIVP